jgi:hypothetical protein
LNILLALDGVLSSSSGEPIRSGVALYYSLNANHRVALATSRTKEDAEHWLLSHGIINYDDLIDVSFHLEGEDLKKRQFILSRSRAPIEIYIDSDPEMCAWVFEEQGIPALLFLHPSYLQVEARPDAPKSVRKWTSIIEAVDRQNVAKAKNYKNPDDFDHLWDEA